MIPAFSGRTIPGLLFSLWLLGAGGLLLAAEGGAARPATELKAGIAACEAGNYAFGLSKLRAFARHKPKLADYAAHQQALCLASAGRWSEVPPALAAVWSMKPPSPLIGPAALLEAQAYLKTGEPVRAQQSLRARWSELPQPEGELWLAKSLEESGSTASAAVHYQKVFYGYPASPAEREAGAALDRLSQQLGEGYPPVLPADMFERADLLIKSGDAARARKELESWATQFGGVDRELAKVRAAAAGFLAGDTGPACAALRSLEPSAGEVEAERLYYLAECGRRQDLIEETDRTLAALERSHPRSAWRLKALVSAGIRFLLPNEPARYAPYYRACYTAFPTSPEGAYCHWKLAWNAYLSRQAGAAAMLREHLANYPASSHAPAALYFLARLEERAGQTGAAKALYLKLREAYPASYYRTLAAKKLREAAIAGVRRAARAAALFAHLAPPKPNPLPEFKPNALSLARIERARLLEEAGTPEWAETELRYRARGSGQAYVLAMELARAAARRNAPSQSINAIKALAQGYLTLSLEDAPLAFWRLAYPLPYRALIERYAALNKLDLHILAGLIRQESVFDARAVSRSGAIGLTQVMPSTGRQLSRKLGIKHFREAMLFRPDLNLRLGSHYLRMMLEQFDNRWEATLAAYNAGASRVKEWLGWGEFREPAEFVETIPFSETRTYVQVVLRNAETYRALYGRMGRPAKPASAPPGKAAAKRRR